MAHGTLIATASDDPASTPIVPWWSFSKTALAAAALVLVDRGALDLDTPLIPEPYTLRHLLQHRSGVPEYGALAAYRDAVAAGDTPWSVDELLRRVGASTLEFAPGARFLYSNVGYLFVRQLIERAVDAPLGDALDRLVFAPLGIRGVLVARTPADFARTAWGNARAYDPRWVYHGCVVGSLANAATWLQRLLNGDLLAPEMRAAMLDGFPYDLADAPGNASYGLGVMIEPGPSGDRLIGHAGGGPGSTIVVFADERTGHSRAAAIDDDSPGTFQRLRRGFSQE